MKKSRIILYILQFILILYFITAVDLKDAISSCEEPGTGSCPGASAPNWCQGSCQNLYNGLIQSDDMLDLHLAGSGGACNGPNWVNFTLNQTYYYIYNFTIWSRDRTTGSGSNVPYSVQLYINGNLIKNMTPQATVSSCTGAGDEGNYYFRNQEEPYYIPAGFNKIKLYMPCNKFNGCTTTANALSTRLWEIGGKLSNNNNKLPNLDIEYSYTCWNGSSQIVNITSNLTDPEGDIIYMSNDFSQSAGKSLNIEFNHKILGYLGFELSSKDLESLKYNFYKNNSYCGINRDEYITNTSLLPVVEYYVNDDSLFGNSEYMLRMNSSCGKIPSVDYSFPNNFNNLQTLTKLYDFNDGSENLNVSLLNDLYQEIGRVVLKYNSTNSKIIHYYFNGSLVKNFEITSPSNSNYLFIELSIAENGAASSYLQTSSAKTTATVNLLKLDSVKHIKYTFNGNFLLASLDVNGIINEFNFTQDTIPVQVIVNQPGTYTIKYVISDAVHQPNEYNITVTTLNIPYCNYYPLTKNPYDQLEDSNSDYFYPPGFVNNLGNIGGENFIKVTTGTENAEVILGWIWLTIFLTALISLKNLQLSLIISGGLCLFPSLVFNLLGSIIIYLFVISGGFGLTIAQAIYGGSSGKSK